ncbi:hypothetical protein RI367_007882 [Sorochytrium milnesiophthora]
MDSAALLAHLSMPLPALVGDAGGGNGASDSISPTTADAPRIAKSCRLCQTRKKKCDGLHPCGRCIKLGVKCMYTPEQKRGPKRKGSQSLHVLQRRQDHGDEHPKGRRDSLDSMSSGGNDAATSHKDVQDAADVATLSDAVFALATVTGTANQDDPPSTAESSFPTVPTTSVATTSTSYAPLSVPVVGTVPTDGITYSHTLEPPAISQLIPLPDDPTQLPGGVQSAPWFYMSVPPMPSMQQPVAQPILLGAELSSPEPDVRPPRPPDDFTLSPSDIDRAITVFIQTFYIVIPVFSEEELRTFWAMRKLPQHTLFAIYAISSAIKSAPRTRTNVGFSAGFSQFESLVAHAQAMVLSRIMHTSSPTVFEAYSLMILTILFYIRDLRTAGHVHMRMGLQVLDSVLASLRNTESLQPHPLRRHILHVFWSFYAMDRKSSIMVADKLPFIALETQSILPPLPTFERSPLSPFDPNVLYASYLRSVALLHRITAWARQSHKRTTSWGGEVVASLGIPLSAPTDSAASIVSDLAAFTSSAYNPPGYLITDPGMHIDSIARLLNRFEANIWVQASVLFTLCSMYTDTDIARRWRYIELIVRLARQLTTQSSSFSVRVATDTADELIRSGYVALAPQPPAPAPYLVPHTDFETGSVAALSIYPHLSTVLAWYDDTLTAGFQDFWWIKEDYTNIRATVQTWRQVLHHPLPPQRPTPRPPQPYAHMVSALVSTSNGHYPPQYPLPWLPVPGNVTKPPPTHFSFCPAPP